MKRGPKPKPNVLKRLAGNPGKRPLNEEEPQIPGGLPECPGHLDDEGKREWMRLCERLEGTGLLTEADRGVMAAYCECWSIHVKACGDLHKYGQILVSKTNGIPYQSPYLNIVMSSGKQLQTLSAELGFTPSSRSHVTAVGVSKPTDPKSKFFGPRIAKTG